MRLRKQAVMLMVAVLLLGACGEEDAGTAQDEVGPQAEEAAQDATAAARDVLASLRTDAERLVDELQSRDAPRAKQALLDKCRDALEKLRKESSDAVGQVERACARIQDTDVKNREAWDRIKSEIARLSPPR